MQTPGSARPSQFKLHDKELTEMEVYSGLSDPKRRVWGKKKKKNPLPMQPRKPKTGKVLAMDRQKHYREQRLPSYA